MNWLPRLVARLPAGVRIKFLAAFMVIVGLLMAVGAAGLGTLEGANRRAEEFTLLQRQAAAYRQLQHDTTWQLYGLTETLLSGDKRMLGSIARQLDQFQYDLDRARFVSQGEMELFAKIKETHGQLVRVIGQVVDLAQEDRMEESMDLRMRKVTPLADRLERLTNDMVNRAEAGMVERTGDGQTAYRDSRLLVIGLALASVAIAILLGQAISGSIVTPVRQMEAQLARTAKGDFSHQTDIANRDELGALGASLNHVNAELGRLYEALESRNRYIRETFGRYMSDEIVEDILDNPDGLRRGGEKREITIMLTDLRGFTALSERFAPEQVVTMLNNYFEVMVEVIQGYNGTINEIIGDSLVVLFGAPQDMPERTETAIACAIAMQNAMARVNAINLEAGLAEMEMGIGLNDSPVIVGNIGSSKRLKYSVVGSGINMASRIESYTVGGQILVSESVRRRAGEMLLVDGTQEILAKGSATPTRIYGVAGIGGRYNQALEAGDQALVSLPRPIPVTYNMLDSKHVSDVRQQARILALSKRDAEIRISPSLPVLANLKLNLAEVYEELAFKDFYAKVIGAPDGEGDQHRIRLTAAPPEVVSYFQAHLGFAEDREN